MDPWVSKLLQKGAAHPLGFKGPSKYYRPVIPLKMRSIETRDIFYQLHFHCLTQCLALSGDLKVMFVTELLVYEWEMESCRQMSFVITIHSFTTIFLL